jgi:hypothetical protein
LQAWRWRAWLRGCGSYVFFQRPFAITLEIGEKDLKRFQRHAEDGLSGKKFGYA